MSTDTLIIRKHEVDRQNIKFEVKQAKNIVFDFLTEMMLTPSEARDQFDLEVHC